MQPRTLLLHFAVHISQQNPAGHPLVLGIWGAWCPVAAWWWRAGVRPENYTPPAFIRAVDDYSRGGTLREYLVRYGLEQLIEDARKYIEEVKVARQRLPHIAAPELLPTFPGGKLPLERRFGIQRELEKFGGEREFFEYVRVWGFVIRSWAKGLPFAALDLGRVTALLFVPGFTPLRLEVWAWVRKDRPDVPYVLFSIHPAISAITAIMYALRSPKERPWPYQPQIWAGNAQGEISPLHLKLPFEAIHQWLAQLGTRITKLKRAPLPLNALTDEEACKICPFQNVCFENDNGRWLPVPHLLSKAEVG